MQPARAAVRPRNSPDRIDARPAARRDGNQGRDLVALPGMPGRAIGVTRIKRNDEQKD
jgi:hypothetical protein